VGSSEETTVAAMGLLERTDSAWGDFNADGDLDLVQMGHDAQGFNIARYDNALGNYIDQNDAPAPPTNLSAVYDTINGGYTFSWSPPLASGLMHEETPPPALGYEVRVGTTPGGGQILSWAHPAGASQQGHSLQRFVEMPAGTYWYEVRTVDSGWLRSSGVRKKTTP
jgi:hypothetical protein